MPRARSAMRCIALLAVLLTAGCSRPSFEGCVREAEGKLGFGDPAGALVIYQKILAYHPDDPREPGVRLRIADIHGIVLGDDDAALAGYAEVIARHPLSEASMLARERHAELLLRRGDFSGAIEDYAALLKHFPRHADRFRYRLLMASAYLSQRNFVRAREELEALCDDAATPPGVRAEALFALAESYFLENRPERAIPYYEELLRRSPDVPLAAEARLHLATCLEEVGRLGSARAATKRSREDYENRRVIDLKLRALGKRGTDRPAVPGRAQEAAPPAKRMDKGE